jgi:hypothetical protein
MLGKDENVMTSDHSRFVLQLVDQFGHGLHLDAGLALRRLLDLQGLEARRGVDAQRVRRQGSIGFFFAFMMLGSDA